MRCLHYTEFTAEAIGVDAPGSKRRRLNDVETAVSTSVIEVAPGGHTLRHSHPYEHSFFVLEGKGEAVDGSGVSELGPGVFLYARPDELHELRNTGDRPLRFLAIEPTQRAEKKPI